MTDQSAEDATGDIRSPKVRPEPPWYLPAVLFSASIASIASTDLYVPSMPSLPGIFGTSAEMVKLTMSLNMAGFSTAVLLHGPLADRFGRRPVIILGMLAFAAFSVLCALASSIEQLIAARLLQGMAACAQSVIIVTVIRDLYTDARAVRMLAIYGMTISLAPALAPTIGGYIDLFFGWRANFHVTAALAFSVAAALWWVLPETGTPDRRALHLATVLRGYLGLLAIRRFVGHLAIGCSAMFALFGFVTAAPFVYIDLHGVASHYYGLYQGTGVAFYFVGNMVAGRLADRLGPRRVLLNGVLIQTVAGLAMLSIVIVDLGRPMVFVLAMGVFVFGMAHVFASNAVLALKSLPIGTGQAAALLGFATNGGGALGALWVGLTHDGSALPLGTALALGAVACLGAFCLTNERA